MHIRSEKNTDCEAISRIQYLAFKDHPAHEQGAEPFEHIVVERLRDAGALELSLVAEEGGELIGHIALSGATLTTATASDAKEWFLLGPVGVLPTHQGQGVGSALIRAALIRMQTCGANGVVLVGDPEFYTRFGFRRTDALRYEHVPAKYVLAIWFGAEAPMGDIVAHKAFCPGGSGEK